MTLTLYGLLGVRRDADDSLIRSAYRRRALATHPDKGGQAALFLEVVHAFEVLSDRGKRAAYDDELYRADSHDGLDSQASTCDTDSQSPAEGAAREAPVAYEGFGPAEERRAAAMWKDFLAYAPEERGRHAEELSYRTTEVLLSYARSHACSGGAPMVAFDAPAATGSQESGGSGDQSAPAESCGVALLAFGGPVQDAGLDIAAAEGSLAGTGTDSSVGGPSSSQRSSAKRGLESQAGQCIAAREQVWICLEQFKLCTGTSSDLDEAINWHIMLVRIKQLFHERMQKGDGFDEALRAAVPTVLDEHAAEGGTDPRLRYVTEYATPDVVFTPTTRDLDTGLRHHAELGRLRRASAGRTEVLDAIRQMTVASHAAAEDQKALVDLLEQQLKTFRRALLRGQHSERPEGINAAFLGTGSNRKAAVYAEIWQPSPDGRELQLLCRGPRHRRMDEAISDLEAMRRAQAGAGGDAAAKLEARRLYEKEMKKEMDSKANSG
eukprot:gnl/TRDRNA2_/TRDRNA2_28189_c0_seq2.p1 gnl/TRDRNA2_/TRDRNA2_28189_c0~~gnl/TRDRNA2_/TRDRNA2_28189_c0_seq2.p1  ORF type:complete len:494 (+),score=93.43 gnl/TRDRNA2_/TRDRNA2_28189_c0_seq2:69-1550(+)